MSGSTNGPGSELGGKRPDGPHAASNLLRESRQPARPQNASAAIRTGEHVAAALSDAVTKGDLPGVVACAATAEGPIYNAAFGSSRIDTREAMHENSLFFIASMTKAVTHVAVLQLIEQKRLSLDDAAALFVPKLAELRVLEGFDADGTPSLRLPRSAITIRQLLAYTAGFAYPHWNPDIKRYAEWAKIPDSVSYLERSLDLPLVSDPGEQWNYGISSEFLGKVVEKISGERLDQYFQNHIFQPLNMQSTYYIVPADQQHRLAHIHTRMEDGSLFPIELSLPEAPEFYPGGVGLFSTAGDYLSLTRMLLGRGELNGVRLLRPESVAMAGCNHLGRATMAPMKSCDPFWSRDVDFFPGQETQWGTGFLLNTQPSATGRSAFSLGWAGACNTFYWVDFVRGVTGVFMASVVPFFDPRALAAFGKFEASVYAML